jgi:membrane-bound ClpP family serine protease
MDRHIGDLIRGSNSWRRCLPIIGVLALFPAGPARAAPTFEFEGPYAVRVLNQGLEIEIIGTFSWALPQQVNAALAEAPQARVVRLNSPGGHIKAALEIADMIRVRNLDTYVSRMCASACTIAFLAGHQRFATETARLGSTRRTGPGYRLRTAINCSRKSTRNSPCRPRSLPMSCAPSRRICGFLILPNSARQAWSPT